MDEENPEVFTIGRLARRTNWYGFREDDRPVAAGRSGNSVEAAVQRSAS
ncbi:hypothetical protein ACFUTV_01100 [Streptomyces sp. NPDC057298]